MAFGLDQALGIHTQAIQVRSRRMSVIASNLANADTPGYQARDLDFREILKDSGERSVRTVRTHSRHLTGTAGSASPDLKYRVPMQPSVDGNTVEPQFEQAAFADNAIRYQASLMFLTGKFRSLSDAITGGMR